MLMVGLHYGVPIIITKEAELSFINIATST